ncbi:MAG: hypothetical protein JST00_40230 [Deltaproteobacteria bacterium]|nr:hypothetical protein [Deltaproteobacteria bacterium]
MVPEPMIKGGAIRTFFEWYQEQYGVEHIREMARRAPEDLRAALDPEQPLVTILPATWYPSRLAHSMLDTLADGKSEAELEELFRRGSQAVIDRSFSVYRFMLENLVTPELYAAAIPRLWRQLHTTGSRRIELGAPGTATSIVTDWPGHHRLLCTITIETMRAILLRMGKKDVQWKRVRCVSVQGGTECITKLTWT